MPSGARLSARQDQAKQQMVLLFNYFVGGYKQRLRHGGGRYPAMGASALPQNRRAGSVMNVRCLMNYRDGGPSPDAQFLFHQREGQELDPP